MTRSVAMVRVWHFSIDALDIILELLFVMFPLLDCFNLF